MRTYLRFLLKKHLFPRSSRANSSHQFLVQKVALDVGNDPFDRCTIRIDGRWMMNDEHLIYLFMRMHARIGWRYMEYGSTRASKGRDIQFKGCFGDRDGRGFLAGREGVGGIGREPITNHLVQILVTHHNYH